MTKINPTNVLIDGTLYESSIVMIKELEDALVIYENKGYSKEKALRILMDSKKFNNNFKKL